MTSPTATKFYPFINSAVALYEGRAFYPVEFRAVMWSERYPYEPTLACVEAYDWLRRNPPKEGELVLHEIAADTVVFVKDGTTNPNFDNRFYFTNEEHALAFKAAVAILSKVKARTLFPIMSVAYGEGKSLAGALGYSINNDFSNQSIALYCWCRDNLVGDIYVAGNTVFFENADDLVLFRLARMAKEAPILELPKIGYTA